MRFGYRRGKQNCLETALFEKVIKTSRDLDYKVNQNRIVFHVKHTGLHEIFGLLRNFDWLFDRIYMPSYVPFDYASFYILS